MDNYRNKKSLVGRLLLRDVSVFQILIYAAGVFLGLFLTIAAFQFYRDINASRENNKDSFSNSDYIVLSKKINGLNFSNSKTDIGKELEALTAEPWVIKAAPFTPADFNIVASIEFGGQGMSTALFFESVPDEFFDELPTDWHFNPEDPSALLPIIVPRDYLALYNFGFAASRGLPKIGEEMLKSFPLRISVSGNGRQQYVMARIAGFTSRLNTIAVPIEFIKWGNATFGNGKGDKPSRIIAEINVAPSDPEVKTFIANNNLEMGGDKGLADSSNHALNIILSVVFIIGFIIAALAVALLFISIFLLIHKTKHIIYRLLALGFKPSRICGVYTLLFGSVNLVVLILAIVGILLIEGQIATLLSEAGYGEPAGIAPTVLLAIGIVAAVTAMCYAVFCKSTKLK